MYAFTTNIDYDVPTGAIRTLLHVTNNLSGDDDINNHHINVNTNTEQQQQQQQLKKSTKLVIPTITDENSATLLTNPNSPNRPVLVDAFAPWCGPCKLLDKVLRKVQPNYINAIDFCRWNVNDVEGTEQLRTQFLNAGYELTKLPSLIVYRDGVPVAVRPGFANEYQIQDFLESTLPDVLERTFDEFGVKIIASTTTATTTTTTTTPSAVEVAGVKEGEEKEEEESCLEAKEVGREIVIVETECITAAVAAEEVHNEKEELANIVLNLRHHEQHQQLQQQQQQQQQQKVLDDDDDDDDDCKTPQECYNRLEQSIWKNRTVVPAMDGIGMFLPKRMRVKEVQDVATKT